MTDTDSRGFLRTIKVPFDIKAIFLGALGYLIFIAGGWILNEIFNVAQGTNAVSGFICQGLTECSISLGRIPVIGREMEGLVQALYGNPASLNWIQMIITGVWFLVTLAIFGGAIARVIAMRIARDEGVGVKEALVFSAKNILSYLLVPVFLGIAIVFFWACNLLAGLTSSIPYAGPFLFIILYPLVILSGLIILLIGVGGLLGLFMTVSAVSTEKNGSLDAISRAFSYLYSRPVQFFFYYFLVFLLASIILLIGANIFPGIFTGSFVKGTVSGTQIEAGFASGVHSAFAVQLPDFQNPAGPGSLGFFPGVGALFSWLFTILILFGVYGFVVAYVMGGTTAIYFALRHEVDGTEYSEIYVEGAEEDEDFGLPPVTPPEPEEKPEEEGEAAAEEAAGEPEEQPVEEEPAAEEGEAAAEEPPAESEEPPAEEAPAGEPEEEEQPAAEEPEPEPEAEPEEQEESEEPSEEESGDTEEKEE